MILLAVALASLPALAGILTPGTAPDPEPEVHRDIHQYVLFAFSSMNFKGAQDLTGPSTGVHGGDVGVNNADGVMSICSNGNTHMDDDTQVVADVVHGSGNGCDLFDVFANEMTGNPPIDPRGDGPLKFATPIIPDNELPVILPFACNRNAPDKVVQAGPAEILPPGVYGNVRVTDGAELHLDGDYTVCNFENGKKANIVTTDRTVVHVADAFGVNDQSKVGPACGAQFLIASQRPDSVHNAVHFGRFSKLSGHYYAPNGEMNLGHGTTLNGTFWADQISSDANVDATNCPPVVPPTTTTTVPPTTTTAPTPTTTTTVPEPTTTTDDRRTPTTTTTTTTTCRSHHDDDDRAGADDHDDDDDLHDGYDRGRHLAAPAKSTRSGPLTEGARSRSGSTATSFAHHGGPSPRDIVDVDVGNVTTVVEVDVRVDHLAGHDHADELHVDLAVREEFLAPRVEEQPVGRSRDLRALRDQPGEPELGRGRRVGVVVAAARVRAHQLLGDHQAAFKAFAHDGSDPGDGVEAGVKVTSEYHTGSSGRAVVATAAARSTYRRPRLS